MLDENVKALPGSSKLIALCFATALVCALLIIGESLSLSEAITNMWYGAALGDQALLIIVFVSCLIARHAVVFLRESKADSFARSACDDVRAQALESLYEEGLDAVARKGSGSIVSTLVEGVKQVQRYISIIVPKVADMMVIPVVLSVALVVLDPISGIICLVMLPCIVFYMRLLGSHAKEQAGRQLKTYQLLANHFTDALRGVATLKVFGAGKRFAQTVYNKSEQLRTATTRVLRTATLSSLVLDLFRVFALAAVAIMLGFRLMDASVNLMPALCVLIMVPELFAVVRRYSMDFHASLDGRNQLRALLDIIQAHPHDSTVSYPHTSSELTLAIRNLSFAYEPNTNVLDSLSFDASKGQRIAIVGKSGSGKSTLVRILAGFSDPLAGEIAVNDVMGNTLRSESWHKRVAYIPQNPHIFNATLRDNVALYQPAATDDAIRAAAIKAGLESTLAELEDGLGTLIGEGGRGLSGGQAQRVALARAFLDDSRDVLVFDEPTAHLDIETELEIKKNIVSLMEGKTTFFATHRLHWLNDMDVVIVLEEGRIAEIGAPDELLKRNGALGRLIDEVNGGIAL